MSKLELPAEFIEFLRQVKGKRSKIVINHILEHGYVTTEDLDKIYGYKHPPRAVRDVREQGVPIETFQVENIDGQRIVAYRFGNPSDMSSAKIGGRQNIPKQFKENLLQIRGNKCAICNTHYTARLLQIDHRIPYEIAGEIISSNRNPDDYMLLCGSCNRAKSWSCENCSNFKDQDIETCQTCYWHNPLQYLHIALRSLRRLAIVWDADEIPSFEELQAQAIESQENLQDYIKGLLLQQLPSDKE